jgi:hypothetical protein
MVRYRVSIAPFARLRVIGRRYVESEVATRMMRRMVQLRRFLIIAAQRWT